LHDEFRLRSTEDCECGGGTTEMKPTTAVGGDMLVVPGAEAEEVAELVMASAEPLGGAEALEAAHASHAASDAAVVLFQAVVFVATGPMRNPSAQRGADREWQKPGAGCCPSLADRPGWCLAMRAGLTQRAVRLEAGAS